MQLAGQQQVALLQFFEVEVELLFHPQNFKIISHDLGERLRRLKVYALATAAGSLRIGILELEAMSHQASDEIQCRASQVDDALRVDENAHAAKLEDVVARGRGLVRPFEHVREAVAAAAAQANPQP